MGNLPSTSSQDVPSPHDAHAQATIPSNPRTSTGSRHGLIRAAGIISLPLCTQHLSPPNLCISLPEYRHTHSSGRQLDQETKFLLELCGLEQALSAHPRDYGTIHPTIHGCRGGPSEQ